MDGCIGAIRLSPIAPYDGLASAAVGVRPLGTTMRIKVIGSARGLTPFTMREINGGEPYPRDSGAPILVASPASTGRRYQHPTWQAIGAWKVGLTVGRPVPGGPVHPLAAKRQQWRGPAGRLSRLKV